MKTIKNTLKTKKGLFINDGRCEGFWNTLIDTLQSRETEKTDELKVTSLYSDKFNNNSKH